MPAGPATALHFRRARRQAARAIRALLLRGSAGHGRQRVAIAILLYQLARKARRGPPRSEGWGPRGPLSSPPLSLVPLLLSFAIQTSIQEAASSLLRQIRKVMISDGLLRLPRPLSLLQRAGCSTALAGWGRGALARPGPGRLPDVDGDSSSPIRSAGCGRGRGRALPTAATATTAVAAEATPSCPSLRPRPPAAQRNAANPEPGATDGHRGKEAR